ncbi:nuclear transport factor 2 family protein [Pseudonocardia acaciae]|uniref:nuclear transport factor 2 family protein n=1 Tax=Pseudonocardia acaciae TaxID=551276 RepID=UPI00048BB27B|nr:nuclear transport factor 2 family protein [Pseudonocardia acaciae]
MKIEPTGEAERLVERLFAAIENADLDTVAAIYAPDFRIWHNHLLRELTAQESLDVLRELHRTVSEPRYEIVRRVAVPDGVFQQHVLRGRRRDGTEIAAHAALHIAVSNGQVTRAEEYLDPAQI